MYILRHPISGLTIGRPTISQLRAEVNAKRISKDPKHTESFGTDDTGVQIWWADDTGKPKTQLGYAWRGAIYRGVS